MNINNELWLDIISARAQYLAEQVSANSPELFQWRNKIIKAHGIDPASGEFDPEIAPFIVCSQKAQQYMIASVLTEKLNYSEALSLSLKAILWADNLHKSLLAETTKGQSAILMRSDGASRGNPGAAACAFVLYDKDSMTQISSGSQHLGTATNNYAEYMGLKAGLEFLSQQSLALESLFIELDSELIVKQINGIYKVKDPNLKLLYTDIKKLLSEIGCKYTVNHIPRSKNYDADLLCNQTLDGNFVS